MSTEDVGAVHRLIDPSLLPPIEQSFCSTIVHYPLLLSLSDEHRKILSPRLNQLLSYRTELQQVGSAATDHIRTACHLSLWAAAIVQNLAAQVPSRPGCLLLANFYDFTWGTFTDDARQGHSRPEVERWIELMSGPLPTDTDELIDFILNALGCEPSDEGEGDPVDLLDLLESFALTARVLGFLEPDHVWAFECDVEFREQRRVFGFSGQFLENVDAIATRFQHAERLMGRAERLTRDDLLAVRGGQDDFPYVPLRWGEDLIWTAGA
jgi:hypothetical protein